MLNTQAFVSLPEIFLHIITHRYWEGQGASHLFLSWSLSYMFCLLTNSVSSLATMTPVFGEFRVYKLSRCEWSWGPLAFRSDEN